MASRRKLEVQDAGAEKKEGLNLKFEEVCVLDTTTALVLGILMILIMMGKNFDAGLFG